MKIFLVTPSQYRVYGNFLAVDYPSLSLAYLGAVLLKYGHSVRIGDIDADKISERSFINTIKAENYDLVGITATTPIFKEAVKLSRLVKEHSNAFTVLGGMHASVMPQEAMKFNSVDFVVKGEGEKTLIELVNYLEGRVKLEDVDGIYYRKNGKVAKTKDRELICNLDEIPFPARHLHRNQNYTYPDTLTAPVFPIITSRGCPSRCTYCATNIIFQHKFRMRTPENIVNEIEFLVKKYKAREIHIWDDNFTFMKSRVIEIKDEIKKRNLRLKFAFPNGIRVDRVDKDILKALKEMGTYSISFGIESGSKKTLNRIKKGLRLELVEEVFKITRKLGMEIWAFFMLGLPDEDEERIRETIDFAKKSNPDIAKFHILKPYPGTKVYEELLSENLILDHDFDNYGIHTPPVHRLKSLTADQILEWQKRAYRSFYLRPGVLMKHIFRLKSIRRLKSNFITGRNVLRIMK